MNSPDSSELSKVYEPSQVESRRYAQWREAGYFKPAERIDGEVDEHFTIVLPPPNVTGRLHMGHALTATIEDFQVRWHRMRGRAALWVPGSDHAGIATQVMVERKLAKEGRTREALGRDAFLDEVWAWKNEHGGIIDQQHEQLGASLDWSRYRFTMDEQSSAAVREAFCRLYDEGLIYRDFRLINWDSKSQTALSDLEVEHREVEGRIWEIAYDVAGDDRKLVVATTRPETLLGDSGVAVHPDDERYKDLIGKTAILPITGREIPIVGDSILVDMEFGTGVVKVTPAHDFNDFETGKRHDLEVISVIDESGCLCAPAPEPFVGLTVKEGRKAVLAELERLGCLRGEKKHMMNVGFSERTNVVVEPLPSHQWFVRVAPMAEKALNAVRSGETKILPASRTADYYRWMENIHDWCISRQLWWGHQIPAWHCRDCGSITVEREDPSACAQCNSTAIDRDSDVLDTWFSSGLWPMSTLGWPQQTPDFDRHYPTSVLETGWDILFFWVARMMMFGTHFTGKAPFSTIQLHSMVLGEDSKKMSKTRGNVVDPLELTESYGTDALRFYLCTMAGQESGIVFSRARVEGYRNFCNKLWNAARFLQMKLERTPCGPDELAQFQEQVPSLGSVNAWIIDRATTTVAEVEAQIEAFRLDLAAHTIYKFVWNEYCDWYLELIKSQLHEDQPEASRVATMCSALASFDIILRLLHPVMPFITEEIWQSLPQMNGEQASLMISEYPRTLVNGEQERPTRVRSPRLDWYYAQSPEGRPLAVRAVSQAIAAVSSARMLKAESKVPPTQKVDVIFRVSDEQLRSELASIAEPISFVGRMSTLRLLAPDEDVPRESATDVAGDIEVILPLEGLVDLDEERARLQKSIVREQKELDGLEKKLGNERFIAKAPPEVVEKQRARLEPLRRSLAKQKALLERLQG